MLQYQEQNKQPLTHTKNLGNLQFAGYLKSQVETVQTIFSIQKYLQTHPAFYYNSLLVQLKGRSIQIIKSRLQQQLDALTHNSSFYHKINAAIQSRRKCINKIKRDLAKVSKFLNLFQKEYLGSSPEEEAYLDWVQVQGYTTVQIDQSIQHSIKILSSIFVDMYRLRDMTIYLVQTVHNWRAKLEYHADRCHQYSEIRYYFEQNQLYSIILKDTNFIWSSKLSQYILFQVKQDPFLIRNVINVEQKQNKTILEKYFVQILYPKEDSIVDKSLKCFEMLLYKYQPKIQNLYQEQQKLIESYLQMQTQNNIFDQQKSLLRKPSQQNVYMRQGAFEDQFINNGTSATKNQGNRRGWVFLKPSRKNAKERITQIVDNHNKQLSIVKPFNIANYAEKNSIALAYISKTKEQPQHQAYRKRIVSAKGETVKKTTSEDQQYYKSRQFQSERQIQSESQLKKSSFKATVKLNHVIVQDPKQHLPQTPKINKKQQSLQIFQQSSLNKIKINSFGQDVENVKEDKIQVQEQQKPLNIKKFYEVFRADTNRPKKLKESQISVKKLQIKQFIQKSRRQRFKSLPYSSTKPIISLSLKKRRNQQKSKSKSISKKSNSYLEYTRVDNINNQPQQNKNQQPQQQKVAHSQNQFIHLKPKSIPSDLIRAYVNHIFVQQHTTSQYFTCYNSEQIISKLTDPYIHCIIFDLLTDKQQNIGQAILSESVGNRQGNLKYNILFLNVHAFQFIISSVLRISQQLLSATPCQQVICPFSLNKLDVVSAHFIQLIEKGFSANVSKFGKYAILQKKLSSVAGKDLYERLYVFTSDLSLKRQYELAVKMMGNYRSLKIQCKCLVLSSNFRLRSRTLFKNTLSKYNNVAIGELYSRVFAQIMTKYHIKQIKQASYSSNQHDQLAIMLKKDIFIRNIIQSLIVGLKNQQDTQSNSPLLLTGFNTMVDLLNYLHYKKHDYYFHFQFLQQSRFILNHELILAQFDQQLSLEFTLSSSEDIYILNNNKKLPITMIKSSKITSQAYLLPTTNQKIKLFLMSAHQLEEMGQQRLDIYSYLCYYFKDTSQIELENVPAVILPNLKQTNAKLNKVRMYDGFFRLFPQKQFYSASLLNCSNLWQSYYPPAVIPLPSQNSVVFQFPFIVGFYDIEAKCLLTAFLQQRRSQSI